MMDCCTVSPTHGQSWLGAAASFVWMWALMMVPMMLPASIPMLRRYRLALGAPNRAGRIAFAFAGYCLVWVAAGVLVYSIVATIAVIEAHQPALAATRPVAAGLIVLLAGLVQITGWKARGVQCCREVPEGWAISSRTVASLRHGVRLGLHCVRCCGNLMAVLLAVGMMDLRWMAVVTAAITVERVVPSGERLARAIGAGVIVWGVVLIVRATGLT
jgi:predicted metal-binding membrane protein